MVTQGAVNGRKGGWRRRGGKEGETRQNCVESEKKERGKRRGEDCADTEQGKVKKRRVRKSFLFTFLCICFVNRTSSYSYPFFLLIYPSIW